MLDQATDRIESVRAKKHDRKIARDPIKAGQVFLERAHVAAFKTKPWQVFPLNRSSVRELMLAAIYSKDVSGRADLLGNVQRRNSIPRSHVQDGGACKNIEIM